MALVTETFSPNLFNQRQHQFLYLSCLITNTVFLIPILTFDLELDKRTSSRSTDSSSSVTMTQLRCIQDKYCTTTFLCEYNNSSYDKYNDLFICSVTRTNQAAECWLVRA